MRTPGGDFSGMMRGNGVLLRAAKMEALGLFHSQGRQINEFRGGGAASQQLAQLPLPFKLCSRPWNTSLVEF